MEIIVRIERQDALVEREYTSREGGKKLFASVGFVLVHGNSRLYAIAVEEMARHLNSNKPEPQYYYVADVDFETRDYQSDKGVRTFCEIRLRKLNIL